MMPKLTDKMFGFGHQRCKWLGKAADKPLEVREDKQSRLSFEASKLSTHTKDWHDFF